MNRTILLLVIVFSTCLNIGAHAQIIRSQISSWVEIINASDLAIPNEAGSDLHSSVETIPAYTQLHITNVGISESWKITVSKQDVNWDASLTSYVRRNGIGISCGSCPGVNIGSSAAGYVQITDFEQDFIHGTGGVNGVDLQFRIEGISLTLDAEYYRTKIVFTLYADP